MPTTSQRRKTFIIIAAIIAVVTVIVTSIFGWFRPIESAVSAIIAPIQRGTFSIGYNILNTSRKIRSIKDLSGQNETLKNENNLLTAQRNALIEAEEENKRLREQLKLLPKERYELLGAHIIGYDPDETNRIRLLNRGSRHDVHENDAVIISDGLLVGKIVEVHATTSKLMTIESQKSAVNVKIAGKDIKGIVKGERGIGLILDLIPQQVDIEAGDSIMTSGLGKDYPNDLTVGMISEIKKEDNSIFQQAFVEPAVNPIELKQVFIITNSQSTE